MLFSFPKHQEHLGEENEHQTWFGNDGSQVMGGGRTSTVLGLRSPGFKVLNGSLDYSPFITWPALYGSRPQGPRKKGPKSKEGKIQPLAHNAGEKTALRRPKEPLDFKELSHERWARQSQTA